MPHIFISYSKKDIDFARHFKHLLQDQDFPVWMDEKLLPSEKWWSAIEHNIDSAAAFIVIMSPNSKSSEWVEREILAAERQHKPIFPVLLAGQQWGRLANIQYIDMRQGMAHKQLNPDFVDTLQKIVPQDAQAIIPPPLAEPTNAFNPTNSQMLIAIIGAIAVILAAAVSIIPPILERIDNTNATTTAGAMSETAFALLPSLNPVEQVGTMNAAATKQSDIATAQAILDNNASATAQFTVDAENDANTQIAAYATETALASFTPSLTPTSTQTNTPLPLSPTPTPTVPYRGILFEDDFESGNLDNWAYMTGGTEILTEDSNRVLGLVGHSQDPRGIGITTGITWTDYAFAFRVKILQSTNQGTADLYAYVRNSSTGRYMATLSSKVSLGFEREMYSQWNSISYSNFQMESNRWYEVRIEIVGDYLSYYVDNSRRLFAGQDFLPRGNIAFAFSPNTIIYIDDVAVTNLVEN
jgi:hypothetical protein